MTRNWTNQTYFYDRWRAVANGVLETAATTFLLLIAVREFHAGALAKGLVAGGGSVGLLISPLVVARVETLGWKTSTAAARLAMFGAICFIIMALVPFLPVFVLGSVLAMAASASAIPLMTQIYQENYPERERGTRFSRAIMIRIAVSATFAKLAGDALSGHIDQFRWLLVVFAAAFLLASFSLSRCPSQPLTASGGTHPLRAMRFVRNDRVFRQTLICWMLMGFANLMMLPLRVEYLANPKYKLALSVSQIAFLTGVIPNLARLVMSPIWGWLFDRMNFFVLRMTLNFGFAIGILSFFASDSPTGMVLGAIVYGISNAGGDVAWGLWVTKFAPPERVADYMSVHTCFTGLRGVLAPLVGFYLVKHLSMPALGVFSALLIIAGTAFLFPEIKFGKRARAGAALTEEVAE